MLPKGLTEEQILQVVGKEYNIGWTFAQPKRQLFRERLSLYTNVGTENKVYVRLIFSTIQTLVSLYYKDSPTVQFMGRQLWDDAIAKNLDRLKDFDYEEMELDKIKYEVQWNKFFYWVGIEAHDWYDSITNTPRVRSVDPTCWIADPNFSISKWFAFHWFDFNATIDELSPDYGYFNVQELESDDEVKVREYIAREMQTWRSFDSIQKDDEIVAIRNLWSRSSEWVYSIYNHYTCINWKKYLFTLANGRTKLIRAIELEPVFEEEKKDRSKVEYPIVIRRWSPFAWDPFGISVCDILEDKQKMRQLFLNLNKIKAENEALWDVFLYDPDVIENIWEIKVPSTWPKYLKANLARNPNPLVELPKSRIKQDSYNLPDIMQQQWFQDIGLDEASLWISPDANRTATEHQRVQKNANLRMVLWARVDNRAEKKFRRVLWYRVYYQYFDKASQKNIYLNNWVWQVPATVRRKDFITKSDIDIKTVSTADLEDMKEKERAMYMATVQNILQNPSSEYSKNYALRKLYALNGMNDEETYVLIPETPDEIQAKLDLELINRDEMPSMVIEPNEDHMTYIAIYQQALETKAKAKAIALRRMAVMKFWKKQLWQQVDNATQNQLVSNAISQSNQTQNQASSLQDVN